MSKSPRWTAREWQFFSVTLLALLGGILLAMSPSRFRIPVMESIAAFFQAFFSFHMATASRAFFRSGSRWIGLGAGFFALLMAFWAFATLLSIATRFGAADAFINGSVTLLFALLAWATSYGAHAAFRRRSWVIASALLLTALFLALCVLTTSLNLLPKSH